MKRKPKIEQAVMNMYYSVVINTPTAKVIYTTYPKGLGLETIVCSSILINYTQEMEVIVKLPNGSKIEYTGMLYKVHKWKE